MRAALDGIRVIDLTVWFQGPVAAQHLADFGAEVIHVERPKGGDQGRGVRSIKALPVGDWNQYFLVINRNKKSLAVDLKHEKGQMLARPCRRAPDLTTCAGSPYRVNPLVLSTHAMPSAASASRSGRSASAAHVVLEIEIVGNLAEKSFARCAIFTATWRATLR